MWSVGCILIELFTGFPLFPGTNEREQMGLLIDVIGLPDADVLSRATRKNMFKEFKEEDTAVPAAKEQCILSKKEQEERLKYIMAKLREVPDPSFVSIIAGCLEWDPLKRLTPEEALNHPWILKGLPPGVLQQHQE
jgi:dual specificity tyrosine-phosphorylation-regulated kinase 2/3/4